MKKLAIALAIAAGSLSSTGAMAQSYVYGAVGASDVDLGCEGAATCDTKGTAFKLGFGRDLGGWGFELGYANFGKAEASDSGITAEAKAQGVTFAAVFLPQLNENWGLSARAGIGYMKTTVSASISGMGSASDSEWNVAPYLGLGVNYAVTKAMKLELGVDFTKGEFEDEKADLQAVSLGVRYAF
jgi:opacity protein-like surface antigen